MEPVAVFKHLHRIGRVVLYETAISLQLTSLRSTSGIELLASKINSIILLIGDYLAKQEEYAFPAIADYEPSLVDAFRQKHTTLREQMADLAHTVQEATGGTDARQRIEAARRMETSYTQFLRFQLKLMSEKETVLQPMLWRYCNEEFLLSLQQELLQHDDCQLCLLQANWIMKALEEEDLLAWLKTVEKKATPQCMQLLLAAAEEQMEIQRFDKISQALTEGALLA